MSQSETFSTPFVRAEEKECDIKAERRLCACVGGIRFARKKVLCSINKHLIELPN